MSALDLAASYLVTLALHATVLLAAVWLAERRRWLQHPGLAELAWRIALLGGVLSAALATFPWPASADGSAGPVVALPAAHSMPTPGVEPALGEIRQPAIAAAPPPALELAETERTANARLALPGAVAGLALLLWCLGLAAGALRLLWHALAVRRLAWRLRRGSRPANDTLNQINLQLAQALAIP
ncbi:MAG: hypothetical protein KA187_01565, partial [Arenimonas sp.]|nr:hypothetical protein [Arenimonas sp.]